MRAIEARPIGRVPPRMHNRSDATARWWLGFFLLCVVGAFGCWLVGTRSLETGSDTETYAYFFESLDSGLPETRLEPGFVYLSYFLRRAGLGVAGYQAALFGLLLLAVAYASRTYHRYLDTPVSRQTLLCAGLMLMFVSPMFVNASINAIRQGLAAPLVFAALLFFHRRHWAGFIVCGALATSLHMSSLMYLLCAPALFLSTRMLRLVAVAAFLLYVSGGSMFIVRAATPAFYDLVMEYTANPLYRSGVRADFAVFTAFWYLLPHVLSTFIRAPWRQRVLDSTSVYLVMALPFFIIGWGFFSNRYLLPAWLAISLIIGAMLCHNRVALLRNPLFIRFGLLVSCLVFFVYVSRGIVV